MSKTISGVLGLFLVCLLAFSGEAYAICQITGQIVSVNIYSGNSGYVYIRDSPLDDHFYLGYTTDQGFLDSGLTAGRREVDVRGDAANCPVSGTNRSIGTVTFLFVYQ